MRKLITQLAILIFAVSLWCCNNTKKDSSADVGTLSDNETEQLDGAQGEATTVVYSENKESLKAYYELPHIKEFYDWLKVSYTGVPVMEIPADLSVVPYDELRLLRNEVFARNGYLFNDGFLRGYFNRQKWYMPIFDVDTFKLSLNAEERGIIEKILAEENRRKENKFVSKDGNQLYNADLVVNYKQFASVPNEVVSDLHATNFSIVEANRAMPFFVYDQNAYQYIPHYITTDLYLFILHKYFSCFLEKYDQNFLSKELKSILVGNQKSLNQLDKKADKSLVPYIEWAKAYNAIALYAITDSLSAVPAAYNDIYKDEVEAIKSSGKPVLIPNNFVSYSELKPRGHYAKNDTLKRYFRAFKWISLNGIDLSDNDQLKGFILFAHTIKQHEGSRKRMANYLSSIEKLAGVEDNLSLTDLMKVLPSGDLKTVLSDEAVNKVRSELKGLNKERVKRVFGERFKVKEAETQRLYFLSSTHSLSGEIFSNLVHIDFDSSKRPFPRGLDIPAVFGNREAESILLNEYKDGASWEEFSPRLDKLKKQFSDFTAWDNNYGFKGVQVALSACDEEQSYPGFMKTSAYNRKELNTMLASWTHIKHDLILYQEKPFAAECGQGGGPEPPMHISYVEPNIQFWKKSLELVDWLMELAKYEPTFKGELSRIQSTGELLYKVAQKEVNGEAVTKDEYDALHYIGGTFEYILLGLLETDHLPDREKSMALIADVYVYNGTNLNVAVGHADDIYVVVPINGEYHIAVGSVFSYYEFRDSKIYNDEEWRSIVGTNRVPKRPEWFSPLLRNCSTLEGQMQYRY